MPSVGSLLLTGVDSLPSNECVHTIVLLLPRAFKLLLCMKDMSSKGGLDNALTHFD